MQTIKSDINTECNGLLMQAIDMIDSRAIASHMFSEYINEVPEIATGTYFVYHSVKIGKQQEMMGKEQLWNDALWLVSMHLLTEFRALNSYNIKGALVKWSMDPENCAYSLNEEEAQRLADWCIVGMQQQGWLATVPTNHVDVIDNQPRKVKKFNCTAKFHSVIELVKADLIEQVTMKCQPLRNKPEPWTDNFTGVSEFAKLRLIKGSNQRTVAKNVLKAANMAQSVAYEVHEDMSKLASIVVDNEQDFRIALGYDAPEKKEKWKGVFEQWKEIASLPTQTALYFPVTYDFRGRMYYRGGVVSPQGSDCCKAAFVFNKGYPLGKNGFSALMVGLATALGSKESVKTRIKQVWNQMDEIFSYATDVARFREFCERFKNADKCQAWLLARELHRCIEWYKAGNKVEDFVSNVPVHQDGTCSGLQHISVITKDLRTAEAVNMTPADHNTKPKDVYTDIVVEANKNLPEALTRKAGKPCVMLGGYGASEATIKHDVGEVIGDYIETAWPELERAMAVVAPALQKFTQAIQARAEKAVAQGATEIVFKTADGFVVKQQYIDNSANVFQGKLYSGHLNRFDKVLDARKMVTATSPNLIHGNDSCHLRLAVTTSRMDVALVHDSYGTHACNYFAFNKVLRQAMYEMYAEYDVMEDFARRNNVTAPDFVDNGHRLEMIKEAVNCFG